MILLRKELAELEAVLPGLAKQLAESSWDDAENAGSGAIEAFRAAGGAGLFIERGLGGRGATLATGVRVQRAIGALCPSLAVASTMHHFSIATLNALAARGQGLENLLLQAIATDRLLMASGFAEGRTGASILSATVTATRDGTDYLVTGSKKPCSLAKSMSMLSASARTVDSGGRQTGLAVVLVPADSPGVSVRKFWRAPVLAGAQSEEVVLESVRVPENLVVELDSKNLDFTQKVGFIWFETLISAAYLGMATRLVDLCVEQNRGGAGEIGSAACAVEAAALSLAGVAGWYDSGAGADEPELERGLAAALMARYAIQDSICQAVQTATELLGGGAFIKDSRVGYLSTAIRALAFHPPSRSSMAAPLISYLRGKQLEVP
ncbi:acyl-CoA dehydrogenase family protein [Amycolatopsis sp. NPDC059090]|uniref:acyl-CoA dehydrogenase family protein n=1 Tax=unclassified Amycolatopsis TaxID=2618356 RepID=UPI00366B7235